MARRKGVKARPSRGGPKKGNEPQASKMLNWAEKELNKVGFKLEKRLFTHEQTGADTFVIAISNPLGQLYLVDLSDHLELDFPSMLTDEQSKKFMGEDEKKRNRLLWTLRREISAGRNASRFELKGTKKKDFHGFTVYQNLYLNPADPGALNRLMDALQEVITIGFRGRLILGPQITSTDESITPLPPAPDEMYR